MYKSKNFKAVADYIGDLSNVCDTWMDEGNGTVLVAGGHWWFRLYLDEDNGDLMIAPGQSVDRYEIEFFNKCIQEIGYIKELYYKSKIGF